jgi:AraC family transcriptional regulator of adaptative response / DNA-3-methyladenine glycosylase II
MRLIADGVVDREGVGGLAVRLGYSQRHIHRELTAACGAGPIALARAARAHTARVLLAATDEAIAAVALAAGFTSVRQFNDTIRAVFAVTPSELRALAGRRARPSDRGAGGAHTDTAVAAAGDQPIALDLPCRVPFAGGELLDYLAARAVAGIEEAGPGFYRRSLRLPHGLGTVELRPADDHVRAALRLDDLRDLGPALQRCRALLDLDSDPCSVLEALRGAPLLGALVRGAPGRRVAGSVDGHELAVRAVLGQQVSLAAARTHAARLVADLGEPLERPLGAVTHAFPCAAAIAAGDPARLAMPSARKHALHALTSALSNRSLDLGAGADRAEARARLLALPGIGPWSAEYVAMRALRDPDAFPPGDAGVRRAIRLLGAGDDGDRAVARLAGSWRPYRAYATVHLWGALGESGSAPAPGAAPPAAPRAAAARAVAA